MDILRQIWGAYGVASLIIPAVIIAIIIIKIIKAIRDVRKSYEWQNKQKQKLLKKASNMTPQEAAEWLTKKKVTMGQQGYFFYTISQYRNNKDNELQWLQKSAEYGVDLAQLRLSDYYLEGKGVPKDEAKAFYWAERGSRELFADHLAKFYLNGIGVKQDIGKGIALYEIASKAGCSWATRELGDFYYEGKYVEKDLRKAADYYEKLKYEEGYLGKYSQKRYHQILAKLYPVNIDSVLARQRDILSNTYGGGAIVGNSDLERLKKESDETLYGGFSNGGLGSPWD